MGVRSRRRIVVAGTVQGVGFRPWAVRQAREHGLDGWAANERDRLIIEIEGEAAPLDAFVERLRRMPPALARVELIEITEIAADGSRGFDVAPSTAGTGPALAVPVDVATCAACVQEMRDPLARRFRYPFTNCSNCGPRYTIIRALPYDRATTTMAGFPLCGACRAEYDDPADRRFHAEPIACPACGPTLTWERAGETRGPLRGGRALVAAISSLLDGGIVAVKGLGGYHLAVLADDDGAVDRLRERKARDDKPFAVMVASAEEASALVALDHPARAELASPRRPIVIARRREGTALAHGVAPGLPDLGVMLAYSPLHHLLLEGVGRPLVMTSGNRTHEPIAADVDASRAQLSDLCDGFLHHDRPIEIRCDDSVVRAADGGAQLVRRSRGYAPESLRLPRSARLGILAVGAELKSTVAVAAGDQVVASHHLGDLEHPAAYAAFEQAIAHLVGLTGIGAEVIAHDLHPEYLSTKWAVDADRPLLGIQHHHAHVASCLVDHGRTGPVLGVAFDGLGMGADGSLWGGELLVADLRESRRVAHLRPVPLPGGSAAIREPWRMALAWVAVACGPEAAADIGPSLDPRWRAVLSLADNAVAPMTSSGGRLFDAIAALAGLRHTVSYEGQAAVELEAAATAHVDERAAPTVDGSWIGEPEGDRPWVLDPSALVADALAGRIAGRPVAEIASGFHRRLAAGLARASIDIARRERLRTVALTGGVFQNALLTSLVARAIVDAGSEVLVHRRVPPNDGGISIGQAAIAAATC